MKTDALLSKREREVMNLVVLGYSAREIAERMNVIYQCVANHLQSIYDKTGTKRTLQALVTWYFTQNFGITLNVSEMTDASGPRYCCACSRWRCSVRISNVAGCAIPAEAEASGWRS